MRRAALAAFLLLLLPAVAAPAEQGAVRRIGVLLHDGAPPGLLEAFRAGLRELGHREGKNIAIELRDAGGKNDRLAALADELVRMKVDLILALNTPAALAARKATTTIPIVITRVTDPVRSGLVASLARPGGNVTGLSFNNSEIALKGMQVLREVLPGISRVAVLSNAGNPAHAPQVTALQRAAPQLGLEVTSLPVRERGDLAPAFQVAARARAGALFVLDDTAITRHRDEIVRLGAAHSLAVVSRYRDLAEAGALFAYGPNLPAVYRKAAHYADRILRGAKPSELPLEEPSQFDLVLNLRTAKALRLTIPPAVLAMASQVID